MKQHVYLVLAAAGLLLSPLSDARPLAPSTTPPTETPAAAERKAAASERKTAALRLTRKSSPKAHRATYRGLSAPNKSFTTPQQLRRQLHLNQNRLKQRARLEARSRRTRCVRQFN